MKLKLPFWATVFTLLGVTVLLGLGGWQLQRLQWKEKLNAQRYQQLQELVDLDTIPLDTALPNLDFNRVRLSGHFLQLGRLHMPAKVYQDKIGWYVIEVFEQDTGRLWLINRGWVPQDGLAALPAPSEAEQTLTAIARQVQPPGRFTPPNNATSNHWYSYDVRAMFGALAAQPEIAEALLARAATNTILEAEYASDTPPIGGITILQLPNNHLQYAFTWLSLALVLLGFYAAFVRKLNKV